MPTPRRPWAPAGHTPIISYSDTHDRLSTLAALTVPPKRQHVGLYTHFQAHHFQAVDVARCVRALLRHRRGHGMRRWARGTIHQGAALAARQKRYPRLPIEECPAYAPERNPVEPICHDFKGHTANSLLRDRRALRRRLQDNTRRGRRSHATLRAFILASKLPSPP